MEHALWSVVCLNPKELVNDPLPTESIRDDPRFQALLEKYGQEAGESG